jgi:hypothetical protein
MGFWLEEARRLRVAAPPWAEIDPPPCPLSRALQAVAGAEAILKKNRVGSPIGGISIIVPPEQDYTVRFELGDSSTHHRDGCSLVSDRAVYIHSRHCLLLSGSSPLAFPSSSTSRQGGVKPKPTTSISIGLAFSPGLQTAR